MALLTDDNAGLVQIAGAVFTVICAMLYKHNGKPALALQMVKPNKEKRANF